MIEMISEDRKGRTVDRSLLRKVMGALVEMLEKEASGKPDFYYVEDLEGRLIEETGAYYSRKALNWILESSCREYMRFFQKCLKKEKKRVCHYLHPTTQEKLFKRIAHELLVVHQKKLLEKEGSGCRSLLADCSFDDLSRMFQMYEKLPGHLEPIATIFGDYVREEGLAVMQQTEEAARANQGVAQEQVLVRKLIELLDRFTGYVSVCFYNHALFYKAMDEAFKVFCNKKVAETSIAEIFATLFATTLEKKIIDECTEETLEKSVKFLVYFSDKDFFSEIYRRKLGQELLNMGQNPSDVLRKLKQQFSRQLASVMEQMLSDLILAKKDHKSFINYLRDNPDLELGFDFSATVLTPRFWPRYMPLDIKLPIEMARCLQSYTGFYKTKTNRRKLAWIFSLGYCGLLGRFNKNPIILIVSTRQAALLLLFNSSDQLSFSDIASQLNVFSEDLCGLLHSLCLAEYKILTKNPDTNTISPSDTFEFNAKFTSRMRKIHISQPVREDECERKKMVDNVNRDRRYAINAAIVRIMNSRKVLELGQLVSECIDQLRQRFNPDIKAIKMRVEELIFREYLERDPTSASTLRYLA